MSGDDKIEAVATPEEPLMKHQKISTVATVVVSGLFLFYGVINESEGK